MSLSSLRARILPRIPANIVGTNGIKAVRDNLDFVVSPDTPSLIETPAIANLDTTFFQAYDASTDSYSRISGFNLVQATQFISVADVIGRAIPAVTKRLSTVFFAPVMLSPVTLVGGAPYRRASLVELAGYPALAYFRTNDRFMPDGSVDATNGGYWLLDALEPNLYNLGAIADFNGTTGTDCLPAYNALLTYCVLTGKKGIIPGGSFYANGSAATPIAGNIVIEGVEGRSRIYTSTTGTFQTIVQSDAFAKTVFDKLFIIPWNALLPTALAFDIQYPSVASFTMSQVRLGIRAVSDSGVSAAPWQHTFISGFSLKNVWYADLRGSVFVGKPDIYVGGNPVGRTDGSFAIRTYGDAYSSVGMYLEKFVGFYAQYGLLCDGYTEAPRLEGTEFIGVRKGVCVPSTTPVGGAGLAFRGESFWFSDFHCASYEKSVDLDTVQHIYGDINVQRSSGSAVALWHGVEFTNCANSGELIITAQGNNGTGVTSATGFVSNGGGGHQVKLITENVDVDFAVTSPTTVVEGKNLSGTGAARDASTFSGANSTLMWSRVDGNYEINGVVLSKSLGGNPAIFPYNSAVPNQSLTLSARGSGGVDMRNSLGTALLFAANQGEANPAEYVTVLAYAVGDGAEITANGAAANVNLRIRPKNGGQFLAEWLASRQYVSDAAAATGGIAVGATYLNSSTGAWTLRRV